MCKREVMAALFVAALASACMPNVPRRMLLGQRAEPSLDASWNAALEDVREAGYRPVASDPTAGRIVLDSKHVIGVQFVVQLYREGWVQLHVEGDVLRRWNQGTAERPTLPSNVAGEYQALAAALAAELPPRDAPSDEDGTGEADAAVDTIEDETSAGEASTDEASADEASADEASADEASTDEASDAAAEGDAS